MSRTFQTLLIGIGFIALDGVIAHPEADGVAAPPPQTVTASVSASGQPSGGVSAVHANGTIRCTLATSSKPRDQPGRCYVTGPGGTGTLRPNSPDSLGTGNGGTINLSCNGVAPERCAVRITY
jgi:hypothetical protein